YEDIPTINFSLMETEKYACYASDNKSGASSGSSSSDDSSSDSGIGFINLGSP
ncbi:hypothetical protein MKW92_018313, partial [Papaver armeniacum]